MLCMIASFSMFAQKKTKRVKKVTMVKVNSSSKESYSGSNNSNYPLGIGKVQLNAGTGVSTWGIPFYAGVDVGIAKDISIGFEASYRIHDYNYYGNGYVYYNNYYNDPNYKTPVYGFMANGNYHFNKLLKLQKKFDVYAGVSAGYYLRTEEKKNSNDVYYYSAYSSGVAANVQAGARYYFTNNFAVNSQLEAGNYNHCLKLGVSFKF